MTLRNVSQTARSLGNAVDYRRAALQRLACKISLTVEKDRRTAGLGLFGAVSVLTDVNSRLIREDLNAQRSAVSIAVGHSEVSAFDAIKYIYALGVMRFFLWA